MDTTKLSVLDKRVKAFQQGYRQNLALLGDDPEEISYLLENYFSGDCPADIGILHVTTAHVGKKDFFKAVAYSLLAQSIKKAAPLDHLIHLAQPLLVQTTQRITQSLKKNEIAFLDVVELLNAYITETTHPCLLVIEEFLKLPVIFEDFYQTFSTLIILQKNCMVVLTSSFSHEAQKVLAGKLNLLFGNFETVLLNEIPALDNFFYLKNSLVQQNPSPFLMSFFISLIATNVLYYDLFAELIRARYNQSDDTATIQDVLKTALYSRTSYCFQKFMKKIESIRHQFKDFDMLIKLLLGLSEGYLRQKELLSLQLFDTHELNTRLQKLIDLNLLENFGNIYKLRDPLFSFWLTAVFTLYYFPGLCDTRRREMLFRRVVEEKVAIFREEFYTDELNKILHLFLSFKNDTIHFGKNRYRLPCLEKTKMISSPRRSFHLFIGEGKEIIFAGIKETDCQESDIIDFIEQGANVKGKAVKKVFIALDTVCATAKLIAKNNKVIIWDVHDINRLLNIYNKPIVHVPRNCGANQP